ncbi:hypothetical protein ACFPT7_00245 [Acidicapsa dinghuensis]|uniref:Uncharacterized protein n=1 Tax=Acidicapsa dinghuensis TaxID=2218256 RepID=A0ABW1ECK5_9BACT|nr:hypothetical protein [Acidicapsa dinghuensis]
MLKYVLIVTCVAIVINLALGDPLELHRIDVSGICQQVRNFGEYVARGEYQEMLSNSVKATPHRH